MEPELAKEIIGAFHGVLAALHRARANGPGGPEGWLAHRLTMPQFKVLVIVVRSPGCPVRDLARHLGLSAPTVSGIVDRLVAAGLLERRRAAPDRRVVELSATRHGRELIAEIFAARDERFRRCLDGLSTDDARALLTGLQALRRSIEGEDKST